METANGIYSRAPYASNEGEKGRMQKGIKAYKINVNGSQKSKVRRISLSTVIAKAKAYVLFGGIKSALKEVEMIRSGKAKAKSFDDLINEL